MPDAGVRSGHGCRWCENWSLSWCLRGGEAKPIPGQGATDWWWSSSGSVLMRCGMEKKTLAVS